MSANKDTRKKSPRYIDISNIYEEDLIIAEFRSSLNLSEEDIILLRSSNLKFSYFNDDRDIRVSKAQPESDEYSYKMYVIRADDTYTEYAQTQQRPLEKSNFPDDLVLAVKKVLDSEISKEYFSSNTLIGDLLPGSSIDSGYILRIGDIRFYDMELMNIFKETEKYKIKEMVDQVEIMLPLLRPFIQMSNESEYNILDEYREQDWIFDAMEGPYQYLDKGILPYLNPIEKKRSGIVSTKDEELDIFDYKAVKSSVINEAFKADGLTSIDDLGTALYVDENNDPVLFDLSLVRSNQRLEESGALLNGWFSKTTNFIYQPETMYFFKDNFEDTDMDMTILIWSFFLNFDSSIFEDLNIREEKDWDRIKSRVEYHTEEEIKFDSGVSYRYQRFGYDVAGKNGHSTKGIVFVSPKTDDENGKI